MSYDYEAMAAEIDRRLNDPSRPPMDLRTEPYTPDELRETVARFRTLPGDTQDRLLDIFAHVNSLAEPERTREIERIYIAVDVVREFPA